ncbi:MAG: hypothetical protein JKY45_12145 [Emcibacter sp.]|nr:hypothetical protein [Emcibacter sp.]
MTKKTDNQPEEKKVNVEFTKAFAYSPNNGIDIERYDVGAHDVSPECADIAKKAGYLTKGKSK